MVPVKGETLRWAMERLGLGEEDLARALRLKPETVRAWLMGEARPTYAQARRLAQKLHLGVPQLLLPPPEVRLPLPDFRRRNQGSTPSPELLEAVYDALRKLDWWRAYRKTGLPFVGRGGNRSPEEVGAEIRERFGIERLQGETGDAQDFLRRLVQAVEGEGILVLRQGHVGANTRRVYDPEEFSGFSLVEEGACLIFINARDLPVRQVFTLVHELAHVWWGRGGLEDTLEVEGLVALPMAQTDLREQEAWADAVAAEALMPVPTFTLVWKGEGVEGAVRAFKVSRMAVMRRAMDLGLISWEDYRTYLASLPAEPPVRRGRGGGDFWRTLEAQSSPTFLRELYRAYREGEVDLKEVATLLNLSLATAAEFLEKAPRGGAVHLG